jgi:hypothetical protein
MEVFMFENEKFSYDRIGQRIFVDNYDKGTRAVFHIENGSIVQKTKTGCNAEGLRLLYKLYIAY